MQLDFSEFRKFWQIAKFSFAKFHNVGVASCANKCDREMSLFRYFNPEEKQEKPFYLILLVHCPLWFHFQQSKQQANQRSRFQMMDSVWIVQVSWCSWATQCFLQIRIPKILVSVETTTTGLYTESLFHSKYHNRRMQITTTRQFANFFHKISIKCHFAKNQQRVNFLIYGI